MANIFSQFMQPVRSVTDRMADFDAQDLRREQLSGVRQQNALQAIAMQRDAQTRAEAERDKNMLQSIAGQSGGDQNALIKALRGSGRVALMGQADAIEKALLDRQKAEADIEDKKASTLKTHFSALKTLAGGVMANPTIDSATFAIDAFERFTGRKMPEERARIAQLRTPEDIKRWAASHALEADKLLPTFQQVNAGNRVVTGAVDALSGQFAPQGEVKKAPEGYTIGPDGKLAIDPGFLEAKKQIAAAGKTNINMQVNAVKPLINEMAEGLGKQLDAGLSTANTAITTINNARELRKLIGDGKVITGPLVDKRMLALRVGETLGVVGKDTSEKLANTAAAIQNLAKAELQAAEAMKGQGQITESERAIIRRAASGTIDMSASELTALSSALEKTATGRIASHQANVERLRAIPGAAPLIPFYQSPKVPDEASPAAVPSASGGVMRFDKNGKLIS